MHASHDIQTHDPLKHFLRETLGEQTFTLSRVAGDASFRHYYRVEATQGSFILMDAPPDREDSAPFLDIAAFLRRFDIPVPHIVQAQQAQGLLLLEDFGDLTFLEAIQQQQAPTADPHPPAPLTQPTHPIPDVHTLYETALSTLLDIQATPMDGSSVAHQRFFDRAMLRQELALFTDWYIEKIQSIPITEADRQRFETLFSHLVDAIVQQPVVFVHRDYHSRNLMWHQGRMGILDFQDAVVGPITYDLASLLRDCYVAWDAPFREHMMHFWLEGARRRLGYAPHNAQTFQQAFDWMAIQRNLKAVGIFGRLSRRDGKHGYLKDIPRTLGYVRETLAHYPELQDLNRLLDRYVPTP